ncbi:MAG: T9SS type B sorting domain-containing protein [Urechidicola sp.]|nr:T9SS type B sorting domain-containing protein [Urechidicola sp.]
MFGQGEANIWYFGENAGLDFNNCDPFAITDGELNTIEGCSSFSDASGSLLFYSDGSTVWNRNHDIMPNGTDLLGDPSSSQSAMIIPKPGSTNIYYIFTVDDNSGDEGFNYYTLDMDEDAGMGDIIEGPIDLSNGRFSDWSEKVAAVKGAETGTFWVVSYVFPDFYAYKVTEDGVDETPVTSSSAFNATDRRGYLKLSPDGTKLALAHQMEDGFLLYDFNDSTGKVSNQISLPLITEGDRPYGVEFSANSKMFYVVASNDAFNSLLDGPPEEQPPLQHFSTLFQFDISSNNANTINSSITIIHESTLFRGALQLGPDRRIYRSLAYEYTEGLPLLGVINNPEITGAACDYSHASVGLLGNLSTQGLPPFIASIFSQVQIIGESQNGDTQVVNGQTVYLCDGEDFDIFSEVLGGTATYEWFFNGARFPFSTDPVLSFTNATSALNGEYTLEVTHIDLCGNSSLLIGEFIIDVYDPLALPPSIQFNNCDVDGIADGFTDFNLDEISTYLTNGDSELTVTYYLSYLEAGTGMNPLDPVPYNNATAATIYARIENPNGCHSVTTVDLMVSTTTFPPSYTGEQMTTCDDDDTIDGLHLFDLSSASANLLAQFPVGQNLSVHYYNSLSDAQLELNEIDISNEYMSTTPFLEVIYVRVENDDDGACFGIGPFVILRVNPRPDFDVESDLSLCINLNPILILEALNPVDNYTYQWKNESGFIFSTNITATVTSGGVYTVTAFSNLGCPSFEKIVNVRESDVATITLEDVSITDDATNNTITINNSPGNLGIGDYEFALDYAFGEYQDEPFFDNVEIGIHVIFVKDKNGCGVTALEVSVIGFPKFFTPNNDGWNDTWTVKGVNRNFYTESTVEIYDRYGKIMAVIKPFENGWDGIYNGDELPETDYWFKAEIVENDGSIRKRQGHFSLVRRILE